MWMIDRKIQWYQLLFCCMTIDYINYTDDNYFDIIMLVTMAVLQGSLCASWLQSRKIFEMEGDVYTPEDRVGTSST